MLTHGYQGDLRSAVEVGEVAVSTAPTPADKLLTEGGVIWVRMRAGDGTHVPRLDQIVQILRSVHYRPHWYVLLLCDSYVRIDARDFALAELDRSIADCRAIGMKLELAPALRLKAELMLRSGPAEVAMQRAAPCLLESIELLSEMKADNELALARAVYGQALVREGQVANGRRELEAALAIFERLGTWHEPERIRRLLSEAG
jgi:hypothetical protein